MARACRVVDDSGVVWNVIQIKMVVGGVVRTINSAMAIKSGVVRQFWPPP
jgi:hypothetical protein